jgi:hypothetical protein
MKYIFLLATLALQFLVVKSLKLLDNFTAIIGVFLLSILIGIIMKYALTNKNSILANVGWGILYGSLTAIGLVVIFIIRLSFNFPK